MRKNIIFCAIDFCRKLKALLHEAFFPAASKATLTRAVERYDADKIACVAHPFFATCLATKILVASCRRSWTICHFLSPRTPWSQPSCPLRFLQEKLASCNSTLIHACKVLLQEKIIRIIFSWFLLVINQSWLSRVFLWHRLHVFPHMSPAFCIPAHFMSFMFSLASHRFYMLPSFRLGTGCIYSRSWNQFVQLPVFPRLALVAKPISCIFSHAWRRLLVFPCLASVACFRTVGTSCR